MQSGGIKSVHALVHLLIPFPASRPYQRQLLYSHQWINSTYVPGKTLNNAIDDETTSLRDHYGNCSTCVSEVKVKGCSSFFNRKENTHEVKSWPTLHREMKDIKCAHCLYADVQ